jgi:general secretion pathway protein G
MKRKNGFSLIELIMVVALLAVLTTIGFSSYRNQTRNARDTRRKADMESIRIALEFFKSNNDYYPNNLNLLVTQNYMQSVPVPPSPPVGGSYLYNPAPFGCTATSTCTTYTLSVTLESGGNLVLTPTTIQ